LKRAGFRLVGAYPESRMGGRSTSCLSPRRYPSPTAQPDRFMGAVARICREEGVAALVPLDEDIVRLLAERGHELGAVTIVGPGAGQYGTLCDKLELTRTARELGLDTPETVVVDGNGPDGPWPPLPSIVKPRTSRSEEAKPMAVDTAAERDAYVAELVADGHEAIVQERILGPRWVIQSVRGPGVFECVAFQVREMWPRGAGLASMKRPSEPPPELLSAARALLDHADYCGPSGISFMERDGRFYPHDANLRLGATTAASLHSGFDFPRRAVEVALGLDGVPFSGAFRAGTHMRFDLELEALVDAWRRRHDGGRPGKVARRMAAVGLSPRGMLDPSPLDAFWFGPLFARAARRLTRPIRRALRARTV
jgi:predicted ATP-grasp superfamily ATP-dependent carboligase